MKSVLLILSFLATHFAALVQYTYPNIPKPACGYGADGPHQVASISFDNPYFPGKNIEMYYPGDTLPARFPPFFTTTVMAAIFQVMSVDYSGRKNGRLVQLHRTIVLLWQLRQLRNNLFPPTDKLHNAPYRFAADYPLHFFIGFFQDVLKFH
jgi:hypothetical protein